MLNRFAKLAKSIQEAVVLKAKEALMGTRSRDDDPKDIFIGMTNNRPYREFSSEVDNDWVVSNFARLDYQHIWQLMGIAIWKMIKHGPDRGEKFKNMEQADSLGRFKKSAEQFVDAVLNDQPAAGYLADAVNYGWITISKKGELTPLPEALLR